MDYFFFIIAISSLDSNWRADFDTVATVVASLTFLPFLHIDHGVGIFKSNKWKIFHLQRCTGRQKMLHNLGSKNAFCLICHASYRNFITLEAVDLHLMMAHKWPKPGNQERKDYYQFLFRYRPVEHKLCFEMKVTHKWLL